MAIPESGLLWIRDDTSTPWPHGMTTLNVRNELSCGIWELTPIFLPNQRSHSSTKTHFVQVASAIFLLPELGTSSSNLYEVIIDHGNPQPLMCLALFVCSSCCVVPKNPGSQSFMIASKDGTWRLYLKFFEPVTTYRKLYKNNTPSIMSLGSMFGKSSLSIAFIKPLAFAGEVPVCWQSWTVFCLDILRPSYAMSQSKSFLARSHNLPRRRSDHF